MTQVIRPVPNPQAGGGGVSLVAWSPDGGVIASGDEDGTLRIWDTASGEHIGMRPKVCTSMDMQRSS